MGAVITVLRNALGVLGELAVRAAPQSGAERRADLVEPLIGEDPYLFPAVEGDGAAGPAGVRVPPSTPPAGHLPDLIDLINLIEHVLVKSRGMSHRGQAREIATALESARLTRTAR